MANPFVWEGNTGGIRTPGAARDARSAAAALAAGRQKVASNGWEGLSQIASALSERAWRDEATAAEEAGAASAAEALAGITPESDFSSIANALSNPWISDSQSTIASALLQQNMQRNDPMYQAELAALQAEAAGGGKSPTSFGTPIWGTGPDGNSVFGTLDNAGNFNVTQTPEGFSFGKDPIRLDTGTEFTLLDPVTRQVIGTQPKNLREAAAETAGGTVQGKAAAEGAAAAAGDIQTGEMALDLLNQIKTHPALDSGTGFFAGVGGNAVPGTPNFDFQNLVEQAKSGAFLSAIQQMRGMGSLSNAEGQAATQAVTRMNTATSKEAFLKAVNDYEGIVRKGVENAQRRGGVSSPPAQSDVVDWMDL